MKIDTVKHLIVTKIFNEIEICTQKPHLQTSEFHCIRYKIPNQVTSANKWLKLF